MNEKIWFGAAIAVGCIVVAFIWSAVWTSNSCRI
jgi:hypothetical protein